VDKVGKVSIMLTSNEKKWIQSSSFHQKKEEKKWIRSFDEKIYKKFVNHSLYFITTITSFNSSSLLYIFTRKTAIPFKKCLG
jgi:hypothetical protein